MTIFQGSRYTSIPVYSNLNSPSYIGQRITSLFSAAAVGDTTINVADDSFLYEGKIVSIADYPNTESIVVDVIGVTVLVQQWSDLLQSDTLVTYVPVVLKTPLKFAHLIGTPLVSDAVNRRPDDIPTIYPREGVILNDTSDTTIIWTSGDRLYIHAYKNYGDPQFAWAILDANPMYQSELDIQEGDSVIIPALSKILDYTRRGT